MLPKASAGSSGAALGGAAWLWSKGIALEVSPSATAPLYQAWARGRGPSLQLRAGGDERVSGLSSEVAVDWRHPFQVGHYTFPHRTS